ncbi:short-chain collagen C4-like [Anneissia japonica]|uniref:short-chain collagen C4-like n=1 Tax=Anneissia japonica TaxID=1529436 RepID=UPI001425738C|nr:short-chain collagen C4-like [Anneissia japonica]
MGQHIGTLIRGSFSESPEKVGLIGPLGRDGVDGRDGRDGVPGIPGSPGVAGVPGDRGQKGDLGNDGPLGTKGEKGFKGEQGKYGPMGPKGDACDINTKDFASMLLQTLSGDQHNSALNLTSQNTLGSLFGGGSVYTRWGRTTCPETGAELVYEGIVGGSWYAHKGGSSEYICLPSDPEWDNYLDGIHSKAYIYGAEYQTSPYDPFEHDNSETLHSHDVPCAVCRAPTRATELMIPARTSCPDRWTKEYSGYLMAGYYDHPQRVKYICVDRAPETVPGTSVAQNGALLYVVEGQCGSLPCLPYVSGRELACSVCTI